MINVTARRTELLEAHRDPPAAENQRGKGHFLGKGQTKIGGPIQLTFEILTKILTTMLIQLDKK